MAKKFSKREAIRFGWDTMKSNFWFFVGILLFVGLVSSLSNILDRLAENIDSPSFVFLIFIISIGIWILEMILSLGLVRIVLNFCDNQKSKFSDLFSCTHLFFKYLLRAILYILIVLGGIILLIIPGIIWAIKFQFFAYLIVDKGLGPVEALKRSALITKGAKWNLFLFGILLGIINFLGFLCLLIGLFATVPTVMVASAFVYRKLLNEAKLSQTK